MKKYMLPGLFALSLVINACFIGMKIIGKQHAAILNSLYDIKPVPYEAGINSLFRKLEKDAPQILKEHDLAFIYTWDTLTTTDSKLRHMLYLDSLFATADYAAMDKLLLSEMPEEAIETYMDHNQIRFRSFTLVSDADEFISSVFTLKKAKVKSRPMQVIINKKGELLYYKVKLSGIEAKDSTLYHLHQIINP